MPRIKAFSPWEELHAGKILCAADQNALVYFSDIVSAPRRKAKLSF
jgi:hypothetical protein